MFYIVSVSTFFMYFIVYKNNVVSRNELSQKYLRISRKHKTKLPAGIFFIIARLQANIKIRGT